MATRQSNIATKVSFDLTGLGTLGSGVGWFSNKITLVSSNLAPDKIIIYYKIACGSVTQGNTFEFYLIRQDDSGTLLDGGVALTSAGQLSSSVTFSTNVTASVVRDQLQALAAQVMSVSTSGTVYEGSFVINDPGPIFALYLYNNTGAALTAASLEYATVTDSIA